METLNLILNNLHWYLLASAVLVYAIVRVIEARARNNPAQTWEDDWLPTLHTLSDIGAKGVDLLAEYLKSKGDLRLANGKAKLIELQTKVAEWETLWRSGRKKDAIIAAWSWYVDLQGKANRIPIPLAPAAPATQMTGSAQGSTTDHQAASMDTLDPDPTTTLDNTPAVGPGDSDA